MMIARRICLCAALVLALGCRTSEPEPTPVSADARVPSPDQPEPEHHLIRHTCAGFELALAEGTPDGRLLAAAAKHAIALGGEAVERATQRWALLPPQTLLELIDRYQREAKPDPQECASLRTHLDRMAQRNPR